MRSRPQDAGGLITVTGEVSGAGVLLKCSHPGITTIRTNTGTYTLRAGSVLRALLSALVTSEAGGAGGAAVGPGLTVDSIGAATFITSTGVVNDQQFSFTLTGWPR
jgi:hypothetical protein